MGTKAGQLHCKVTSGFISTGVSALSLLTCLMVSKRSLWDRGCLWFVFYAQLIDGTLS